MNNKKYIIEKYDLVNGFLKNRNHVWLVDGYKYLKVKRSSVSKENWIRLINSDLAYITREDARSFVKGLSSLCVRGRKMGLAMDYQLPSQEYLLVSKEHKIQEKDRVTRIISHKARWRKPLKNEIGLCARQLPYHILVSVPQ